MSLHVSKLDYTSEFPALKNDGVLYTGSLALATSLTAGQQLITTSSPVTIATSPEFCLFFAKFTDYYDVVSSLGSAQWYNTNVGAASSAGCTVTAPLGSAGPLDFAINPVINGTSMTVQLLQRNPYSNTITIAAQTIYYAFIEYSLAN